MPEQKKSKSKSKKKDNSVRVVIRDRLYIPKKVVPIRLIKKHHDIRMYDEKTCRRCEILQDRHSDECDDCSAFKGRFKSYELVDRGEKPYWSLPRAEVYDLEKYGIYEHRVLDKTSLSKKKLDKRLEFNKKPYDYQVEVMDKMLNGDGSEGYRIHGILKAAARSGKCVVGSSVVSTGLGIMTVAELFSPHHIDGVAVAADYNVASHLGSSPVRMQFKKRVAKTIEVVTEYGYTIEGTYEHPILTRQENNDCAWRRLDTVKLGAVLPIDGTTVELESSYLHANNTYRIQLANKDASETSDYIIYSTVENAKFMQVVYLMYGIKVMRKRNALVKDGNNLNIDFTRPPKLEQVLKFDDVVVSVNRKHVPVDVYDLTVNDSHSFICNGIIAHNTLMSLMLAVKLGGKTLIMAHQYDLLEQFVIELTNSTNIEDIDKFEGKKSFGICSKLSDFEQYDICLAPYQMFISKNGRKLLNKVRHMFSTMVIDEVHRAPAKCFSEVVDKFSARYKFGLTATDERKDEIEFVIKQMLGDVTAEAKVESLKPKVYVVKTNIKPKYQYKTWVAGLAYLVDNKQRNDFIMKYLERDLKRGRKLVIPVAYRRHVTDLVKRIRKLGYTAEEFVGGGSVANKRKRKEILERARKGKIDVVVGIRSLFTGVNVPIWSGIYTIVPISNPPNYYQEVLRVCTPMEGKPDPIIRIFVDEMGISTGCFRTCYTKTFLPLKFRISEKQREIARTILGGMKGGHVDEEDDSADYADYVDPELKKDIRPKVKALKLFK